MLYRARGGPIWHLGLGEKGGWKEEEKKRRKYKKILYSSYFG